MTSFSDLKGGHWEGDGPREHRLRLQTGALFGDPNDF